jgi:recombination protein RecA
MVTKTKTDRLKALLDSSTVTAMKKKYGGSTLVRASELRAEKLPRIPSGVFALDRALGGGWAVGRVHTVFGHKSSGKTTLLKRTIAQAQKMCAFCYMFKEACKCKKPRDYLCAFIDIEGTFDPYWAKQLGVDLDSLLLSRPEYAEQGLDIAEGLLRSEDCDLLVLDSIAFLTPLKEIQESTEQETMGQQPRLVGKGIRKLNSAMIATENASGKKPTLFFTNQIRMKLGVMFGNPETQPGGFAPGFAASTEVKLRPAKYKMDEDSGMPEHADFSFKVEKNKTGVPKMEGEYRMMLCETQTKSVGDIYDENFIMSEAQRLGVVRKSEGGGWECLSQKFRIKRDIEDRVLNEPEFKRVVIRAILGIVEQ